MRALPAAVLAAAALAAFGCKGRDDLDGSRRPIPGLTAAQPTHALPVGDRAAAFDLYDNRAQAIVHRGGSLVIDCGSPAFAKYIGGGYREHWQVAAGAGGVRAALTAGLGAELTVPVDADVARDSDGSLPIRIRARAAVNNQLVSVFLNEHRLGDISMPDESWRQYAIHARAGAVEAGENVLRFYFRSTGTIGGHATAAAVAAIAIGGDAPAEAPAMKAGTVVRGGERMQALTVPGRARISYYFRVPRSAPALLFAHAAPKTAHLAVRATPPAGGKTLTLWTGTASAAWRNAEVDLGAFAGRVIRLDLVASAAASWGRPTVVARVAKAKNLAHPPRADNVIVWVVSSLRADRVVGGDAPTPAFRRFARAGAVFSGARTPVPSAGPAEVALLTGVPPRGAHPGDVPARRDTLAERFRDAGFRTALISASGAVDAARGFARGFDVYENPARDGRPFSADVLWQRARGVLTDKRHRHVFLYIVTVEPELPYTPSKESLAAEWHGESVQIDPATTAALSAEVRAKKRALTATEKRFVTALYDAEVRDADAAFGGMLADLDKLGIADRTAVILVGDHGEELWERGDFGHQGSLYEEVLRVPVAMRFPGRVPAGVVVRRPVELMDVYATALDLAGIAPAPAIYGKSLVPLSRGAAPPMPRAAMAELPGKARALRLGRYKLVVPTKGQLALYDLIADPGERENLIGRRPVIERYLRTTFGISVAFGEVWNRRRWGTPNDTTAAFPADQGL